MVVVKISHAKLPYTPQGQGLEARASLLAAKVRYL